MADAAEAEEPTAAAVLERLVTAKTRYDAAIAGSPSTSSDDYASRLARWQTRRDQTAADLDRAARALMVLIRAHARRYPNTPTDLRGNPVPYPGEPVDANVRAMDPGSPLPTIEPESGAVTFIGCLAHHAAGVDPSVVEAAMECARAYDSAWRAPQPNGGGNTYRRDPVSDARSELQAATRAAQDFVDYLDAVLVTM